MQGYLSWASKKGNNTAQKTRRETCGFSPQYNLRFADVLAAYAPNP
jgi:hypothetical protein